MATAAVEDHSSTDLAVNPDHVAANHDGGHASLDTEQAGNAASLPDQHTSSNPPQVQDFGERAKQTDVSNSLEVQQDEGAMNGTHQPPNSVITDWKAPQSSAHPQAAEILRQVEFYFSDENLPHDAHLLGLIREGKGSVRLSEILSFKKMRKYKPMTAVREVLKQSTVVEITADNKRIRRRTPLKRMVVRPKVDRQRQRTTVPDNKPWLTKGLMKPTGFEPYITDGPIKPADFEQDREDYAEDESFISRIEKAIMKFNARRKMHQETRSIFEKFMIFGGMESNYNMFIGGMFTGGISTEEKEEMTKKEIAERTAYYGVSERVMDGFIVDDERNATWVIDFEAVTKGFLSSHFIDQVDWYDEAKVKTATNVLRNFFNYLLLHDVCPEYKGQIMASRKICDVAEEELPKLATVDESLPGGFNTACSTLFGGNYADLHAGIGDWVVAGDDVGWSKPDAQKVFFAGVAAYGTEEQLTAIEAKPQNTKSFEVVSTENLGLEVTGVQCMTEEVKQVYEDPRLVNTFIKPMGRLRCIRWEVPHAPPMDLPKFAVEDKKTQEFEFLMEEEILKFCYPGLKMEVCVKELDIGIKWIDYLETTYASFFVWLVNENIRDWKEPGPPRGYMSRQPGGMEMEPSDGVEGDEEYGYDDEEPD